MGELRKDPVSARWVIMNTDRVSGPDDFDVDRTEKKGGVCPFCYGNEHMTPPEVLCYRENTGVPNSPGWSVRGVPNKFPALKIEGGLDRQGIGIFDMMNGVGAHEVIIENPDHYKEMPDLEISHTERIIRAYRERFNELKKDTRFKYLLIFKNYGASAGASLEHGHTQLIALPIVPKRAVDSLQGAAKYYAERDRCVFCDMIRQELQDKIRIVTENDMFLAYCPFVARFPYEVKIIPKAHRPDFGNISNPEITNFAKIMKDVLTRIRTVLHDPPYNFTISTSPIDGHEYDREDYHWRCNIFPKLAKVAGFEWGSGFYINPTPPECSVKILREAAGVVAHQKTAR